MRCSKCGNEIADNAKFCGKCGNKVLAEAQEFSYKEPAVSENKNSGKLVMKPKTKKIIGIVALLMIVGVSAVLFGRFYRKNVAMKNDVIIVCGSYGNNTKAYEYNGELKELGVSGKDIHYMGEGIFSVRESENSKKKLIDINGNLIKLNNYDDAGDFSEGLARVEVDGKYGFVDKEGNEVVSPKYDAAGDFSEGLAGVEVDGKYGFVDKEGNEVVNPKYDAAGDFSEGLARVEVDGKYGFVDKEGNEVVSPKYDDTGDFSEGLARVWMDRKCGFIDKEGNEVVSPKYDAAGDFNEGLARVEVDGKHGFIDKEGNEVVSPKFDYVRDFIEGLALVEADGKFSCIDKKGKDVISPKYEVIGIFNKSAKMVIAGMLKRGVSMSRSASEISEYEEAFSEQLIIVREGDKRGVINLDGKVIIPSIYRYIAIIRR